MKKLLCAAAAAVMVISSTVVPAAGQEKYSAQTRPDFTIVTTEKKRGSKALRATVSTRFFITIRHICRSGPLAK